MQAIRAAQPGQAGETEDQRAGRRRRVLKAAIAAFNNELSTFPCVVRDLSESGARLEFNEGAVAPSSFVLHIELDGYKVDCERIWQKGRMCGVRFASEKRPTRIHRTQVINTSENALSESFMRDLAQREQRQSLLSQPQPKETPLRPAGPRWPVFGKRVN